MKWLLAAALLLSATPATAQTWDTVPRDKDGRPWPDRLPYRKGAVVPEGYYVDTHLRSGLLIAGTLTFGVSYGVSVYIASMEPSTPGTRALYAPIAGPYIFFASTSGEAGLFGMIGLFLGAMQLGGTAMTCIGLVPKTELVRVGSARMQFVPILAREHNGLAVMGTF